MTDQEVSVLIRETVSEAVAQTVAALQQPQREYLNTEETAVYLALSKFQLEIWRSQGDGPPYIKLARLVRYKKSDLDAWMAARRQSHTGQNA